MSIDEILERFEAKFVGANALGIDRLHKGTKAEVAFYIKLWRERKEMQAALDTAAHLIAERDAELEDLREAVKASGQLSMGIGDKRKDSE